MTLLVLLIVWFTLSPIFALLLGALIRAGQGPSVDEPFAVLLEPADGRAAVLRPRAPTSGHEDLAA